jgi:hypothetical protein
MTKERSRGYTKHFFEYNKQHPWSTELIKDLAEKKFITLNNPEVIFRDNFRVNEDLFEELFDSEFYARELYSKYPMTFPISDSGSFVARTGISPEELAKIYPKKIGYNVERHNFVLQQLAKYIQLVHARKINGHKLSQWVNDEMWDTVSEIEVGPSNAFKTDI